MDTILTNLVCFILGIVCCAIWIKINKPATPGKPVAKKPSNAQRAEPLIKRPTKDKATWPHREIEDMPELRALPTDAELEAAQAKRTRKPKRPTKQDKKQEPQRRATWADVFGEEQIPQEWQPVTYTPVSEHRAKFKQQLSEKQEGET